MRIHDILRRKGHQVVTISSAHTVMDAVGVLVQHGIGALVVMKDDRVVGIFTERDILRLTARNPGALASITVGSAMTPRPVTATPDDDLYEVMDVMTERKIRHLPVIDGDRLVGIVSIGDVVNACRRGAEEENSHLRQYIQSAV
ncbi:MAG: CBS domain-containing protein [Gemmatimonadetes bacterium]|nr:CBS domain-containing protein [Gemmatimonadota bacterium]